MNLNYIREFVMLTQIGKFQETADRLYVSQSVLSKHIMALEKELGNDLFIRSKKQKQTLTGFGKSFLPYALQLVRTYDEMEKELLAPGKRGGQQLVVGSTPMVPLYTLFQFLDSFLQENPDFHVELVDAPRQELLEMLRSGRCDLIITQQGEDPLREFHSVLYAKDRLSALLPDGHPLAERESLRLEELAGERRIEIAGALYNTELHTLYEAESLDPGDPLIVNRPAAVVNLVRNRSGIAIMPYYPAFHFSGNSLPVVPLEPELPVEYRLLYPRGRYKSEALLGLLDYIRSKRGPEAE